MRIPDHIPQFGDKNLATGAEDDHLATIFSQLRKHYPEAAKVAYHVENEGRRNAQQAMLAKMKGMVAGVADIHIQLTPCFICELKAKGGSATREQIEYLSNTGHNGAWVCIAWGWEGFMQAWKKYLAEHPHYL